MSTQLNNVNQGDITILALQEKYMERFNVLKEHIRERDEWRLSMINKLEDVQDE